jgi:ketosteroid isomerase-like protein
MSEANVELVTSLQPGPRADLVALFRDDESWSAVAKALEPLIDEGLESGFVGVAEQSRRVGIDGFREVWLEWLAPWESYRTEIDRVIDGGDDVLVIVSDYGRKTGMAAEVRLRGAAVWTVRGGRITRAYFYADRLAAVRDVGLDAAILEDE